MAIAETTKSRRPDRAIQVWLQLFAVSTGCAPAFSPSQCRKQLPEIRRQRRLRFKVCTAARMHKSQNPGMECLAFQGTVSAAGAVYRITEKRIPDARHVHANLMRAARLQAAFNVSMAAEAFQNAVVGDGFFAVFVIDRHSFAVGNMSSDGGIYRSFVPGKDAVNDGFITPCDGMIL